MTQLFQSTYDGYVNLVTIDLTAHGDQVYGFIDSSTFEASQPEFGTITWQGQVFAPLPYTTSGYKRGGDSPVKPKLSLPDFSGIMWITLSRYNLAAGSPVTRYQALAAGILGNDPAAPFSTERYLLNSASYDGIKVEIELATHVDYQRAQFPAHMMYRGEYPGIGSQLAGSGN